MQNRFKYNITMDDIIKEIWNWQKCGLAPKLQQNRKFSKFFQAHNTIDELELLRKHIDAIREAYKAKKQSIVLDTNEAVQQNKDIINELLEKEEEKDCIFEGEIDKILYVNSKKSMLESTESSTFNEIIYNSTTFVDQALESYTTRLPMKEGDGCSDKKKDNNVHFLRKVHLLRNELDLLITEYYNYNINDNLVSKETDDKNNILADDLTVIDSLATQTKALDDEYVYLSCVNIDANSNTSYTSACDCDLEPINEEVSRMEFKNNFDSKIIDNIEDKHTTLECNELDANGDVPNIISFLKACNVRCDINYDTKTCSIGTIDETISNNANKRHKEERNSEIGPKGYAFSSEGLDTTEKYEESSQNHTTPFSSPLSMIGKGDKLGLPKILITETNGDKYYELTEEDRRGSSKPPSLHRKNSFYVGRDEVDEDSKTITNVPFDFICFLKNGSVCCDIDYTNRVCTLFTSDESELGGTKINALHNTQSQQRKSEDKLLLRTKKSFHSDLKGEVDYKYVINDSCEEEGLYTTNPPAFRDIDSDSDVSSNTTLSLMDGYDLV